MHTRDTRVEPGVSEELMAWIMSSKARKVQQRKEPVKGRKFPS